MREHDVAVFVLGAIIAAVVTCLAIAFLDSRTQHTSNGLGSYCVKLDDIGTQKCVTPAQLDQLVKEAK